MTLNAPRLVLLFAFLFMAMGCKSKPAMEAAYTPVDRAVKLELRLESGSPDFTTPTKWLAAYTAGGHSAKFRVEFDAVQEKQRPPAQVHMKFGEGRFSAVPGSDSTSLLSELKTALKAKAIPPQTTRSTYVRFAYVVDSEKAYRRPDGFYTEMRPGDWRTLVLFFGRDEEGELFFNMNPVSGVAEFSRKDPALGDFVLAELAKVL